MPVDIKNKIIEGLKLGRPVLFPSICFSQSTENECTNLHIILISGYKRVSNPKEKKIFKDLFKAHTSWGESWQKQNNDGWVDGDELTYNTARFIFNGKLRVASSSVMWLD